MIKEEKQGINLGEERKVITCNTSSAHAYAFQKSNTYGVIDNKIVIDMKFW